KLPVIVGLGKDTADRVFQEWPRVAEDHDHRNQSCNAHPGLRPLHVQECASNSRSTRSRTSASMLMSNLRANSLADRARPPKSRRVSTAGLPDPRLSQTVYLRSLFTTVSRRCEFMTIVWKNSSSGISACLKNRTKSGLRCKYPTR